MFRKKLCICWRQNVDNVIFEFLTANKYCVLKFQHFPVDIILKYVYQHLNPRNILYDVNDNMAVVTHN